MKNLPVVPVVDSPYSKLRKFVEENEPQSECCKSKIHWYLGNGFGATWLNAHYGRCSCGRILGMNGENVK